MEKSEEPIKPAYEFGKPNEPIMLLRDTATLEIGGQQRSCEAEVWLRLVPRAGIDIRLNCVQLPIEFKLIQEVGSICFKRTGAVVPGFFSNLSLVPVTGAEIRWTPSSEPVSALGGDSTEMNHVMFHLFNFNLIRGTHGTTRSTEEGFFAIQHVKLAGADWQVELQSLPESSANAKFVKEEGGYGLTHIGVVRRTDGRSFDGSDAQGILNALRYFLSFAQGAWCNPICAVGFDTSLNRVWGQWSAPNDSGQHSESWFDPQHADQLASLWPGFLYRWGNENWREAIREVVYWYRNANNSRRGIDAGIVLMQTALERLSYEFCVRERKLIELQGFKSLRASDKFRLLLSSLNIPIGIPNTLTELTAKGANHNWQDGPHALTEIRNSLVHPEHKQRKCFSKVYPDAWKLGLCYLELSMLCVLGYNGTYSNRLTQRWVGEVEKVPWLNIVEKERA